MPTMKQLSLTPNRVHFFSFLEINNKQSVNDVLTKWTLRIHLTNAFYINLYNTMYTGK